MLIRHNRIDGDAISATKGSNIVYASALNGLQTVKENSFLRLAGENAFYVVQKLEPFVYLCNCEVVNQKTLSVEGNVMPKLQPGDNIKLSFKEYELDIVTAILDYGEKYTYKDVLVVQGGCPSIDVKNGKYNRTEILVNGIDNNGKITRIGVNFRGKYLKIPPNECEVIGGSGKNAKFELSFKELDNCTVLERKIKDIDYVGNQSMLYLWDQIPNNLSSGNISCDKWAITLHTNYLNENRVGVPFSISHDFTPALQLPLMSPNSFSVDVIYNHSINMLEAEILKLRAEIETLKNKQSNV